MTVNGRRGLRLFFKFGLLVSLPLAGYLWAQTGASPEAIALGAVCVVMALGAEGLASTAESHLSKLRAFADAGERGYTSEVTTKDEKIRQMDRIVETLSNQNHDLRGKLVSIHGEVHRIQEETAHLNLDTPAEEASGQDATEEGSDITDLTSRRRR